MKNGGEKNNLSEEPLERLSEKLPHFPYKVPDDDFDKVFAEEMRQHEISAGVLQLRLDVLHKIMDDALSVAGIQDKKLILTAEVCESLQALLGAVKEPDSKQTDILLASQVALMVAWRVTRAAMIAASRQYDPASHESPDDPLPI